MLGRPSHELSKTVVGSGSQIAETSQTKLFVRQYASEPPDSLKACSQPLKTMTDDQLLNLFLENHHERLFAFAVKAACGNWRDAEDGLQVAMSELWPLVLEHFRTVSMEERTDAGKSIPRLLWLRIKSRVLDARRSSLKHEQPLGESLVLVDNLDDLPDYASNEPTDAARKRAERLFATKVSEGKAETLFLSKWNHLSEAETRVLKLTVLREPPLTDDETAKEIGTTPGTVTTRRCSALRKFRS